MTGPSCPLWLVGGLDPTAGAGVIRDAMTARQRAPSLPIQTVITAQTRQGHGRPAEVAPTDAEALAWQLAELPAPSAIKLGLIPAGAIEVVRAALDPHRGVPIVLDPVLVASDGGELGAPPEQLAPLVSAASVVTPNLSELRALSGHEDIEQAQTWWSTTYPSVALLAKGLPTDGDRIEDRLMLEGETHRLQRPRHPGPDPRGTGCALATAIACGLAQGQTLLLAVQRAVQWLDQERTKATRLQTGSWLLP